MNLILEIKIDIDFTVYFLIINFLADLFQQLCSLNGGEIFDEISQILSSFGIYWEIWTNGGIWLVDLVIHMTLEWDLIDLGMTWSFPLSFPVCHDARAWGTMWFPVHHDARACENDIGKVQECDRKIFGGC